MDVVKETAITIFSHEIGSKYLSLLYEEMYSSGTFKLFVMLALVATVVTIGLGLHRGQFPQKAVFFLVAISLSTPYQGAPAGFVLVDAICKSMAAVAEKATLRFIADNADTNQATNMHPGLVMEMIASAASTKMEDPENRNFFAHFMGKCASSTLRLDGQQARFDDFFNYDSSYEVTASGLRPSFIERILDRRSLENNDAAAEAGLGANCLIALNSLRTRIAKEPKDKPWLIRVALISGTNSNNLEEMKTTESWFENWKRNNSPFLDLSRNLRIAMTAEYEKDRIIAENGSWWENNYHLDTKTDSSLRALMLGLDSSAVNLGFSSANIGELPSRMTGTRWAASLGAAIKDLKEKIELAPYYIVGIKNILKILCVVATLSLFTGRIQFFLTWAGSWFAVTLMPSAINAQRAINNSTILSKLAIQDIVGEASGNKALAFGVDIEQARALLEEFVVLSYALINQELQVIGFLAGSIVAGSFLVGMVGNGAIGWITSTIKGQLLNKGVHAIPATAGTLATMAAPGVSKFAGAGVNSVKSTFVKENSTPNPNLPHPTGSTGYSFSGMFPKEKS